MATIKLFGYVSAMDPGIVHTSSCEGSINVDEITPETNLNTVLPDWWRSDVSGKVCQLHFLELRDDGALFKYGQREFFVEYGNSQRVDEVGLSYAYGGFYVSIEK